MSQILWIYFFLKSIMDYIILAVGMWQLCHRSLFLALWYCSVSRKLFDFLGSRGCFLFWFILIRLLLHSSASHERKEVRNACLHAGFTFVSILVMWFCRKLFFMLYMILLNQVWLTVYQPTLVLRRNDHYVMYSYSYEWLHQLNTYLLTSQDNTDCLVFLKYFEHLQWLLAISDPSNEYNLQDI